MFPQSGKCTSPESVKRIHGTKAEGRLPEKSRTVATYIYNQYSNWFLKASPRRNRIKTGISEGQVEKESINPMLFSLFALF